MTASIPPLECENGVSHQMKWYRPIFGHAFNALSYCGYYATSERMREVEVVTCLFCVVGVYGPEGPLL